MSLINKYKFVLALLLVIGAFAFFSPVDANAGAGGGPPGCCINNSGNCAGGCGVEASNCATEQLGACPNVTDEANCNGELGLVRCFVPFSVCNQTTNTKGICGPGTGGSCANVDDCPDPSDPECVEAQCLQGTCIESPLPGSSENPACNPPVSTTIVPTLSQWGIIFVSVILGLFALVTIWRSRKTELQ